MKSLGATLIILLALSLPSHALAHHCREGSAPREETLMIEVPATPVADAVILYVKVAPDAVGVWQESGQEDGLQTRGGSCGTGHDERHYGSDDEIISVALP